MDPMPVKCFSMKRLMIIMSIFMTCGASSMYAYGREVSVSLDNSVDENTKIMIYEGDNNPVFMDKNRTYTVRVSNVVQFNVFHQQRAHSVSHPIKPSTTSLVLKISGLGVVEVEQSTLLDSLYCSLANLFFAGN